MKKKGLGLVWFGLAGLAWFALVWLGLFWFGFGLVWLFEYNPEAEKKRTQKF